MSKQKLLYLVHRIPYPPNKGDKIRSYHLLKHLSQQYDVYLGTFIDDDNDWQYRDVVKALCKDVCFVSLNPLTAKLKSVKGFLTNQALTLPYYFNRKMQKWVDDTVKTHNISLAMVYSSSMAQFIESYANMNRLIDFVDVDSDKWEQYAQSKHGLSSWVYRRESKKLAYYESNIVNDFDYSFLVSESESDLLKKQCQEYRTFDNINNRIGYYNNGVDLNFFNPSIDYTSPYDTKKKNIAFTGAMDYWANVDAVKWFCKKVWPLLKEQYHDLCFTIVGSNPSKEVLELVSDDIHATGRVEDIRPYIACADLIVAPMQIARGIQNKVLEALSLNKTVVMTPAAYEGLVETLELDELCKSSSKEFAVCCSKILEQTNVSVQWRQYVEKNYSWHHCLLRVDQQLSSFIEP